MHKMLSTHCSVAGCLLAIACLVGAGLLHAGEEAPKDAPKTGLAGLVDTVPDADKSGRNPGTLTAPDLETMKKIYDEVLKGGKDSVAGLAKLLVEPGKGADYKARYVLHGLVTYVDRQENEEPSRVTVREGLVAALAGDTPPGVKKYILEELKHIGGKAEADAIAKFLTDDDMCEFAAQALVAIKDTSDLFRAALPAAGGKRRLTIMQELGVLRDTKAVEALKKAVADPDPLARLVACEALGNIGDAAAVDAVLAAAEAAKENDRVRITNAALLLAQRLVDADRKVDAERIYSKLWDSRKDPEERQVRIAALQGLVVTRGELNDILAAMKTGEPQIRAVAIRSAITLLGQDGTQKLIDALQKAPPADRPDLLTILGARRDPAAIPGVLAMLKDGDEKVRMAAMQAASAIGAEEAAKALVAIVKAGAGKERDEALDCLSKMRGKEASAVVGGAIKDGDAAVKAGLLGVLANRRAEEQVEAVMGVLADPDAGVRRAALKALGVIGGDAQLAAVVKLLKETKDKAEMEAAEGALVTAALRKADACANLSVDALKDAQPATAAALIRVLGAAGTGKALKTVIAETKSDNADRKDVAIRALAEWRDKAAANPMLELAQGDVSEVHQALLLRGVNRLVELTDLADSQKTTLLAGVLKAAKGPEAKRKALSNLSNLKTQSVDTVKAAAPLLDDESVKEEACQAVVKIAEQLVKKVNEENYAALREPLDKVIKGTKTDGVRRDAEKFFKRVKKD